VRIGVNALYLIPGGVGGTEIYLRELPAALAGVDRENRYLVFTNRETGSSLVPAAPNFEAAPQPVRAAFRPARILWEQTGLPLEAARRRLDVLLNPGFTAPVCCTCPSVTVFHDLQHKRHPEFFRWHDLPFWRLLLWAAAHCSRRIIAVSEATRRDLLRFYRLPPGKIDVVPHGVGQEFFARRAAAARPADRSRSCWPCRRCIPTKTSTAWCASSPGSGSAGRTSAWSSPACAGSSPRNSRGGSASWAWRMPSSSPDGCRAKRCWNCTSAPGPT
jgi:glycosyltransferase involved in cell wall biosynthesis